MGSFVANTLFQALSRVGSGGSPSVEDVAEVVFGEKLDILLASRAQAVEQVVSVGPAELGRIGELRRVVVNVVVLLDGLDNVALALELEELFGEHDVGVIDGAEEVAQVPLRCVQLGRVAEGALVVGHGPGWRGHHAQVVILGRVHAVRQCHLGERSLLGCSPHM